jgi:hypothetical protein
MKYLDYRSLKEFYTIPEVCELFGMTKQELKQKCEDYDVRPTRNEIGAGGFSKYDIRRLHNKLYYEDRAHRSEWDPWE